MVSRDQCPFNDLNPGLDYTLESSTFFIFFSMIIFISKTIFFFIQDVVGLLLDVGPSMNNTDAEGVSQIDHCKSIINLFLQRKVSFDNHNGT